jgi:hypothetical protein
MCSLLNFQVATARLYSPPLVRRAVLQDLRRYGFTVKLAIFDTPPAGAGPLHVTRRRTAGSVANKDFARTVTASDGHPPTLSVPPNPANSGKACNTIERTSQ